MEQENFIPVVDITTTIVSGTDYRFKYYDYYWNRWVLSGYFTADTDERAIGMADDYYRENGFANAQNDKCALFDGDRIVKKYGWTDEAELHLR